MMIQRPGETALADPGVMELAHFRDWLCHAVHVVHVGSNGKSGVQGGGHTGPRELYPRGEDMLRAARLVCAAGWSGPRMSTIPLIVFAMASGV